MQLYQGARERERKREGETERERETEREKNYMNTTNLQSYQQQNAQSAESGFTGKLFIVGSWIFTVPSTTQSSQNKGLLENLSR